jgi:heme A synthase
VKASVRLGRTGAVSRGAARAPGLVRLLTDIRFLAAVTLIATYGLIVLGGTVRATESGTACPDWPLCHGRVVPPLETKVMIEYAHRLAASIVGFLILGTLFWAWRRYKANRLISRGGAAVVFLLAVQVVLGGVTVLTETSATAVAAHLSVALALFSLLILVTAAVFLLESRGFAPAVSGARRIAARLGPVALLTFAGIISLIIVGAYVSKTGAGLAYPDWPLFNGGLVSAGGRLADLHYAHRLLAAVAGLLLLAFAWRTAAEDRRPPVLAALAAAVALYAAQVLVGASNIWLELATPVRVLHLALASALWGVLVFAVGYRLLASASPRPEGAATNA